MFGNHIEVAKISRFLWFHKSVPRLPIKIRLSQTSLCSSTSRNQFKLSSQSTQLLLLLYAMLCSILWKVIVYFRQICNIIIVMETCVCTMYMFLTHFKCVVKFSWLILHFYLNGFTLHMYSYWEKFYVLQPTALNIQAISHRHSILYVICRAATHGSLIFHYTNESNEE